MVEASVSCAPGGLSSVPSVWRAWSSEIGEGGGLAVWEG